MARIPVTLIHADDFYNVNEIDALHSTISSLPFIRKEYGEEIENFNLIQPGLQDIFSFIIGEQVTIDEKHSGVFRRPMRCQIHFESFNNPNEWCFMIALERTTFNVYKHLSGAKNALYGTNFNYKNLFEWDYTTNILLEKNQGLFYRPWLFHSIEDGLIHYFKLNSGNAYEEKI